MNVFSVPSPSEKDALKIILLVGKSKLFNTWLMTASDFHTYYELMTNWEDYCYSNGNRVLLGDQTNKEDT